MTVSNKNPKQRIFDFNIDVEHMLGRPRIHQLFVNALAYPLTVVYAPAGYGKTTAALQFAKTVKAQVIYMSLNELDKNPQHFWSHLADLYAQMSPALGAKLAQLGFPASDSLFAQFTGIIKDIVAEKHILIIDDFHVAECPELEDLLLKIAPLRLKDLHILILSRTLPTLCSVDLRVKRLLFEITKEHLRFDLQEILAYYQCSDIEIGEAVARTIDSFTEGWASAVYLSSLYYRQNPDTLCDMAVFDIDRLIENTVYRGYTEEIKDFLVKLSILERFDVELCSYLTGRKNAYELLARVLTGNSLLKISEDKQTFAMHRLFRDFLQNKLTSHGAIDKRTLHIRAAEYYEYKNDIIMALLHLDQAGEYERMAALILKNKCASTFSTQELLIILRYMDKIPREYCRQYPMLLLISAMSLTRTKHAAQSLELAAEVERLCANPEMPQEEKDRLLGEVAVIRAIMSFNNVFKMVSYFKEASRLLPGGSELLGEKISFTFGSPSMLYLYHSRSGALDDVLDVFAEGFPFWEKLSSCGYGGECLLRAEAAFERGDYASAEREAYRAIYRAEEKNQNSVVIVAKLLLIKTCAVRGKYRPAAILLKDMRELMNYRKALIYLSTLDMCTAVFQLLCGDIEDIPKWLAEGDLAVSAVNRAGFGMEFLIYAQVLLHKRDYLKLESIIPGMFETYNLFTNQYGVSRTHILAALANYHLYGIEKAVPSLSAALAITEPDRLIMPYLEYGEYLLPVFRELASKYDSLEPAFARRRLDGIRRQMKEYISAIAKFRAGSNAAHPERAAAATGKLTKREAEILGLIAAGLSGEKIARELHVTPINVRVITSKIYNKLGVNSRVEAVRAAIENGLIK